MKKIINVLGVILVSSTLNAFVVEDVRDLSEKERNDNYFISWDVAGDTLGLKLMPFDIGMLAEGKDIIMGYIGIDPETNVQDALEQLLKKITPEKLSLTMKNYKNWFKQHHKAMPDDLNTLRNLTSTIWLLDKYAQAHPNNIMDDFCEDVGYTLNEISTMADVE